MKKSVSNGSKALQNRTRISLVATLSHGNQNPKKGASFIYLKLQKNVSRFCIITNVLGTITIAVLYHRAQNDNIAVARNSVAKTLFFFLFLLIFLSPNFFHLWLFFSLLHHFSLTFVHNSTIFFENTHKHYIMTVCLQEHYWIPSGLREFEELPKENNILGSSSYPCKCQTSKSSREMKVSLAHGGILGSKIHIKQIEKEIKRWHFTLMFTPILEHLSKRPSGRMQLGKGNVQMTWKFHLKLTKGQPELHTSKEIIIEWDETFTKIVVNPLANVNIWVWPIRIRAHFYVRFFHLLSVFKERDCSHQSRIHQVMYTSIFQLH